MLRVESLTKMHSSDTGQLTGGVKAASFVVPRGSFFTLLGPSGCGKTTTLRCIAGLETPDQGVIKIDDELVFSSEQNIEVPPNKRNLGMVFQSYAIWPHMTVAQNVAFPLEVLPQRLSKLEIAGRVSEVLGAVGLGGFEQRHATQLSGGQQQRLSLARAIAGKPSMLLLDEPLSNLDVKLREEMRLELKRLQLQAGLTAIYVTHDQTEALALSDSIAIMNRGQIVQIGTPKEVYDSPVNRFVAEFVGTTNFLDAQVMEKNANDTMAVRLINGALLICGAPAAASSKTKVTVCIRPEAIKLSLGDQGHTDPGTLTGVISSRTYVGSHNWYQVDIGGQLIQAVAEAGQEFAPGSRIMLLVQRAVVLPPE
jgi:iron(III) transport system ATP-binding protein